MDHDRSLGMRAVIGLRLDGEDFTAQLEDDGIHIERGTAQEYDLHFESSPRMLAAAIYGGQPISALESANVLKVIGDRALAEKFVTLFPLPDKAPLSE